MTDVTKPVVVTTVARNEEIPSGTLAKTVGDQPNVIVKAIQPMIIVLVRAARTFLQVLVGLLTAGATGMGSGVLPVGDFATLLKVSASLAVAPAVVSIIQNVIELLAKMDQSSISTLRA